jgi:hypothetical protein
VLCRLLGVSPTQLQVGGLAASGDGGNGHGHQEQDHRDQPYRGLDPVRPAPLQRDKPRSAGLAALLIPHLPVARC